MADELIQQGKKKIQWACDHMPILAEVARRLKRTGILSGVRISLSIHLEAKTACLALTLKEAGAELAVSSSNPLSTQDDVALALAQAGVEVHARRGESDEDYISSLVATLAITPQLVLDDGGDLTALLHGELEEQGRDLIGINEETTTGVVRLRKLKRTGKLRWPAVAVNDALMKHLFDNRYGTGQSTWDAIMRTTNLLVAGKDVVVVGYGWCGRGIALRARGLGARVTVCEVDPIHASEALLDGFSVAPLDEAIKKADFLITSTGCRDVVTWDRLLAAKDGLILANAGHFDVEIDMAALRARARGRSVRENVEEFELPGGKRVYVLAEGRLVNLVAGDGHPVEIMDLSFSLQALSASWLLEHGGELPPDVYPVPREIDEEVAKLFLAAKGIAIDSLTQKQRDYLGL